MLTSKRIIRFLCAACVVFAIARAGFLFAQDTRARGAAPATGAENGATSTKPVADSAASAPAVSASGSSAHVASQSGSSAEDAAGAESRAHREKSALFPGFRYWMAPDSLIDRWPWGDGKYLPIEASSFKEWLSVTRRRGLLQDYVDGARFPGVVSTIHLRAKLSGDTLEGEGSLVTVAYPIVESDAKLATPPMQSFEIATSYPEDISGAPSDELATYPDALSYLPNAADKTRLFLWSKRGKTDASGNLYYEFNFHSVLHAELLLETGESDVVTVSGGVVLPVLTSGPRESSSESPASSSGVRTWRVCSHGRSQTRVTIVHESNVESSDVVRSVGYRQESSYRLSLSGVELSTRFDFERVPSHFSEATIVLDPSLSFMYLEWGSTPSRPVSTEVAEDGTTRVRVRAPSNLVGETPASLRVVAFCPIWFGERRLPTVRVIGDGIDWRESLMRLAVSEPLTVSAIDPVNAAQTRDASRTRTEGLNFAMFKLFDPNGSVRMTLRHNVVAPPFDSATDCYFTANEVSAKTTLFFNFDGVERNRVSVLLAPGWDVDSVQATQAESIAYSRGAGPGGRRVIWLTFKNPPTPGQPTRVTLAARYSTTMEERLPVDRLCPLELQDSLGGAHALSVRTDSSSQIRYTTSEGRPFAPMKTTPNFIFGESLLREATPLEPGGMRLWVGDQTVGAFASLENVRSNYSVDLSCACVLEEDWLQESWKLHCVPSSGMRVDRIVFFVSLVAEENNTVASDLEWRWSTSIEPERYFEAPRLSDEEAAALHAPENSAAYEIRLATSRSIPFDLNVFCSVPATHEIMTPLIFFPDFTGRSVELVVESNSKNLFKSEGAAIVESTVPSGGSNDSWFLKKAFRYDPTSLFGTNAESEPGELAEETSDPTNAEQGGEHRAPVARKEDASGVPYLKLTIIERAKLGTGDSDVLPLNSLCWFENYDSYYQNDGVVHHCAAFYLENRGRDFIRIGLTLPTKRRLDVDENADDSLEPASSSSDASNDAAFFSNSLDFTGEWEYVDHGDVYDSISAIWADDVRAPWTLWKLPNEDGAPERYVVDVRLLAKRRYVRVELDYCDSTGKRLSGSRRIRPIQIECDVPTLSGVWNAWFPPQFQTRRTYFRHDETNVGFMRRLNAFADSFLFSIYDKGELEAIAERVANRLGDEFALRLAISQARRVDSGEVVKVESAQKVGEKDAEKTETPAEAPSTSSQSTAPDASSSKKTTHGETDVLAIDMPSIDASTWGDVFGSPSLVANLFAPEYKENDSGNSQDVSENFAVESAFGKLEGSRVPTTLLLDRYALINAGVSPNLPLPIIEGNDPWERTNLLLESANIKLLLVSPRLALLTTGEALTRQYGTDFTSLCGPSICAPSSRGAARRIHDEILDPNTRRYVGPATWRELVESTNPWATVGLNAADGTSVQGWTFASIPIGRSSEGVYIVNRYALIALEFFGIVGFVVFFWRRTCVTPRFLIGTMGFCLAILCPARYEVASLARGVLYGALCLFVFRSAQILLPTSRREGGADRRPVNVSESEYERREGSARGRAAEYDESVSSDGYVDFARMSPEELHYVRSGVSALPNDRDGKTSAKTLLALLTSFLLVVWVASSFARVPDGPVPGPGVSSETPANSTPTPASPSGQSTGQTSATGATSSVPAAPSGVAESPKKSDGEKETKDSFREPYRVFVPTDGERKPSGEYYWIDSSFYERIRSDLRSRPHERSWRVVDALYEGSVNYNSFTKTTSIFSLKATYTVVMDNDAATISLPAVQLAADGRVRFDRQTVTASYSEDGTEIYFDIQAEPGAHTLELTFVPPQFFETTSRLSFPILPVASARLELDVSVDAPALDAPNAIGKIERSARRFSAELGPIDQLIITKAANQARSDVAALDVEQYFLMRPRASQTDVRAAFHYQTIGGKLQTLEIECDPSYSFSGYCKCDVGEIESVDSPTSSNPAMRVTFKRPISGPFTVNVDFVARNFSGIGRAPIPRISARDANVVKNWLALAPDAGVECVSQPGVSGLVAAFQSAWGQLESRIVAAYDLDAISEMSPIDVRLVHSPPETEETTTCVFSPAFTKVAFRTVLTTSSDLFRVLFDVPKPFVVESLTVLDENGATLSPPEQTLSEDGLSLEFEGALRGKYTIEIVGRTRRTINHDADFPLISVRGAVCHSRYARVYCAPNVDLEWKSFPETWAIAERELFATLGDEPSDVCPVEVYSAGATVPSELPDASVSAVDAAGQDVSREGENAGELADNTGDSEKENAQSEQPLTPSIPVVAVHMNVPALLGYERLFLYPVDDSSSFNGVGEKWKATYQLHFQTLSGRIDRIYVAADDLYSLDPLLTTSFFTVEETTTPDGEKAYLFTPKRPILPEDGEVELLFSASFKSDPSGVCLPRFQTLPSSLYEDFSNVRRTAYLPTLRGSVPILWSSRNMKKENDPRLDYERRRGELVNVLSPGLRSMAMNGAAKKGGEESADGATSDDVSGIALEPSFPAAVEQTKRVGAVSFERYACGKDASAWLSSQSDRMKIDLARYEFFVNERREIFGNAVFMIKSGSNDNCVVEAPAGYHVLEARVNGVRRLVERAAELSESETAAEDAVDELNEDNDEIVDEVPQEQKQAVAPTSRPTRWVVELGGSPYVKRLEISFQATGKTSTKTTLFNALRRRSESFSVDFLRLESSDVKRVLWICAFEDFESENREARWTLAQHSPLDQDDASPTSVVFHDCVPARVNQAGGAMCRVNLEDAAALLSAYENDSALLSGARGDDLERMRARWLTAWRESAGATTPYMTRTGNSATATLLQEPLLRSIAVVNNGEFLPPDKVDANFPIPNWSASRISEIEIAKNRVFSMPGMSEISVFGEGASAARSQSLWTLHTASYSRILFGSTDACVSRIDIAAKPKTFDFLASPYSAAIFLLMATAAILQLLDSRGVARGLRSVVHVAFMFVWVVCFFLFGWTLVALVGAFLLAVVPFAWSSFKKQRSSSAGGDDDATNVDPQATTIARDHVAVVSDVKSSAPTRYLPHDRLADESEIDD